jgi:hypothetical protein
VWDCNGSPQQTWDFYQNPATGAYYFINHAGAKCLDADLNSIGRDGTKVQVWDCTGAQNQQWAPALALGSSARQLVYSASPAASTFDVLDEDNGGGNVNGAKVQLWSQNGAPNQAWTFSVSGKPA